jgi:uridine phosphorylase
VITELADLGARRLVRVGTCGALDPSLALGDLLIATEAISADGTSQALGAGDRIEATPELTAALEAASGNGTPTGPVVSTDLFYDGREGQEQEWAEAGAIAVEMEAATLFAIAKRKKFEAGAILLVSDMVLPERRRIAIDQLRQAEKRLGEVAAQALTIKD